MISREYIVIQGPLVLTEGIKSFEHLDIPGSQIKVELKQYFCLGRGKVALTLRSNVLEWLQCWTKSGETQVQIFTWL